MFSKLKIFAGRANQELAEEVSKYAGIPLSEREIFKFSNDESFVQLKENVRNADIFIIQPTSYPVNDNLVELLIMIDALKRASASRINAIIPYYGYARTDKKDQPRVPITAKLVADLLEKAGVDRVITIDLHANQIQGFFDSPVDHLSATPIFARYFKSNMKLEDVVVVSPDSGGAGRARALAKRLNCTIALGDKRRQGNDDKTEILNVVGDVKGKTAILYDDIIDTGGSLTRIAKALHEHGAKKIYAACVHGVLSGKAVKNIDNSHIEKLFITNTIPLNKEGKKCKKIVQLSIAELLAMTIKKIHIGESVSILFR